MGTGPWWAEGLHRGGWWDPHMAHGPQLKGPFCLHPVAILPGLGWQFGA